MCFSMLVVRVSGVFRIAFRMWFVLSVCARVCVCVCVRLCVARVFVHVFSSFAQGWARLSGSRPFLFSARQRVG